MLKQLLLLVVLILLMNILLKVDYYHFLLLFIDCSLFDSFVRSSPFIKKHSSFIEQTTIILEDGILPSKDNILSISQFMNVEELTFVSNNFMNIHTVLIEQCPVVRKICFQDNTFSYSEHNKACCSIKHCPKLESLSFGKNCCYSFTVLDLQGRFGLKLIR